MKQFFKQDDRTVYELVKDEKYLVHYENGFIEVRETLLGKTNEVYLTIDEMKKIIAKLDK